MAKAVSLHGAVVGKLAGNVYSVNSGIQIVRAYQPNVSNPSTEMQVTTRSKFKLCSQLAAAVSPVLAIPKNGLVSARNQFVSQTMTLAQKTDDVASVNLINMQLTKSSLYLPTINATRGEGNQVTVNLAGNATANGVKKVLYAAFTETAAGSLVLYDKRLISVPGVGGDFEAKLNLVSSNKFIIYAYGILEQTSGALAKYGNYSVDDATFIASLISSRSATASGLGTTTTRSITLQPA